MSDELPDGWTECRLGCLLASLVDFRGRTPKKLGMDWGGGEIPALSALNVRADRLDLSRTKHFGSEALYRRWMTNGDVARGDIVVTTEAPLGNVALIPDQRRYILSQRVILLKCAAGIEPAFLAHQLRAPEFRARLLHEETGTGVTGIRQSRFVELTVRVPPLPEQRRIVNRIDALLERVNAARERLEKVPLLMKRFRQSVLAKAFRGELTDTWRDERGLSAQWEEVLIEDLASVGTGSTPLRSNSSFFSETGTPWVTSAATGSPFVTHAHEFVTRAAMSEHRLKRYPIGTLLVAMYGEGKTRGQVTELMLEATINQACAAVVVDESRAVRDFVKLLLERSYFQMRERAEGGNQPNLNLAKIKEFPVPLPSLEEQREIVAVVRKLLSRVDALESSVGRARRALDRAPQAILQKAFSGELVPTEAELARAEGRSFESASELLARINRSESAPEPSSPRRRRRQRVEQTAT